MEETKLFGGAGKVTAYLYISKGTLKAYEEYGLLKPDLIVGSGHRRYLWSNVVDFRKKYELKEIPAGVALMTTKEVCGCLGISGFVLKQLGESGKLMPCLKLPPRNRKFYLPSDVDEYLAGIRKSE